MKSPRAKERSRGGVVSRRGAILLGLQGAAAAALMVRMRQLQVTQADEFRLLAEENRINLRIIPPARGRIFDRWGHALAVNEQNYRAVIVREEAGDVEAVLRRLAPIIGLNDAAIEDARKDIMRRSSFVPVTIAERLTWDQVARISLNAPVLPGVTAEVGQSRRYPFGADLAHVVGYVGPVSDNDLKHIEDPDPLLLIPRFQIGKTSVERKLEDRLRGKAGVRKVEVNAAGRVMRELDRQEGRPGAEVQLTIDTGLQNFAQARLGDESASAVVIDVRTGDLHALASAPAFDPNLFVRGIASKDYSALLNDDHRPLSNKVAQGAYPPGSTFKMIVALAALEAGVMQSDETVRCPGFYELGDRRFHCWKRAGHGRVDLAKSLRESCDVYYYEIAQRTGIERISDMARRFGIGVDHDVPLSALATGLAPTKDWKFGKYQRQWLIGDTLNAGIGQGFVLASPLQLAIMSARLASGRPLRPRLVRAIDGVEQKPGLDAPLDVDPAHLDLVRRGMFEVSNLRRGTAYRSRIAVAEMQMAGKTGTSQVRNITAAERARGVTRNEDLPWNRRDHALFVAFAPFDDPRFAVSVVVEHGGGGSKAAAPIARDILLRALYGTLPPMEAYPAEQRREVRQRLEALPLLPASALGPGSSQA